MAGPLLILDFDGVVNMLGTSGDVRRRDDVPGHVVRATMESGGVEYPIRYSQELVGRMNAAAASSGATWLWLSTWCEAAITDVNPVVGTRATDWLRWDSVGIDPGPRGADSRSAAKFNALRQYIRQHSGPFVWVDDEATALWRDEDFPSLKDDQALVIAPDPRVGMSLGELESVERFLLKFRVR